MCDSLPSVSAAGVLPLLSGDEGATSGSFSSGGERSVRGGVPGRAVHLHLHLHPPHCSGPTGRPPCDVETVWQNQTVIFFNFFFFKKHHLSNICAQGWGWSSRPSMRVLSLGWMFASSWLWKKTLFNAVWHWPGLITVNRWNRGTPKAFYVILDANQMLSSHDVGFPGAQPLNMVLIVLAICVLRLMRSKNTPSSIRCTSAHLTTHIWAHKCCCSPGIVDPGHWVILLYYFSHFYHQPLRRGEHSVAKMQTHTRTFSQQERQNKNVDHIVNVVCSSCYEHGTLCQSDSLWE